MIRGKNIIISKKPCNASAKNITDSKREICRMSLSATLLASHLDINFDGGSDVASTHRAGRHRSSTLYTTHQM